MKVSSLVMQVTFWLFSNQKGKQEGSGDLRAKRRFLVESILLDSLYSFIFLLQHMLCWNLFCWWDGTWWWLLWWILQWCAECLLFAAIELTTKIYYICWDLLVLKNWLGQVWSCWPHIFKWLDCVYYLIWFSGCWLMNVRCCDAMV